MCGNYKDYIMNNEMNRNCLCDETDRPFKDGECPFPEKVVDDIAKSIATDFIKKEKCESA